MTDLTDLGAAALARVLRAREASASEAVAACLARIERLNPALNAVVTLDADGALAQARAADTRLAGGDRAPLLGVPLTLKDCHETAGMRTTAGHPPLADYLPAEDGTTARRLKEAGAILLGKTNVSPLLADLQSDNAIFGRTNNPWRLDRTPGGSSGGAAAAVAARFVPLEIGSDIGGSIRIPAHCCGIVGIKPTERRVSNHGHIPDLPGRPRSVRYMNCVGPLAREIDDLALALALIQGPDGHDIDVPPAPADGLPALPELDPRAVPLAFATAFPGLPVSAAIEAAVKRLAVTLATNGWPIEEALPDLDFGASLATRAALRPYVRRYTEPPDEPLPLDGLFDALNARERFIRVWESFLRERVLLCPVMITTAFPHCPRDTPVRVDGVERAYDDLAANCRHFNLSGHPVVTFPIGLDDDNLPIGVQLVGPHWSDARLLAIAQAIISQIPPIGPPPL